jgi:hypothetical protein
LGLFASFHFFCSEITSSFSCSILL